MNIDLKIIKKKYGENMMKLCRENFSTILEKEGELSKIILEAFYPTDSLYKDLIENEKVEVFKNFIFSIFLKKEKVKDKKQYDNIKDPYSLISEAGYNLFECKSEDEIKIFQKYYAKDEEICTLKGGRLENNHVFFAVKKNVEEIKRENYKNPTRQDEYGTSVISIQFIRDEAKILSIKNRYNHIVKNCDATFSNDLDNIIEGLTESFEKIGYKQKHKSEFFLQGYIKVDGKYYKYNYIINDIFYCPNNIIIDKTEIEKLAKEKYIVFDHYILDLENKNIRINTSDSNTDSFTKTMNYNIEQLKEQFGEKNLRLEVIKKESDKLIKFYSTKSEKSIEIKLDDNNRIIEFYDSITEKIGDGFLMNNESVKSIKLTEVEEIGNYFLYENTTLEKFEAGKLVCIKDTFLPNNNIIKSLKFDFLEEVGNRFMCTNQILEDLSTRILKKIGDDFLSINKNIKILEFNIIEEIGNSFMKENKIAEIFKASRLKKVGDEFFCANEGIKSLELNSLVEIGDNFFTNNEIIENFNAENLRKIGDNFLCWNSKIKQLHLNSLVEIGNDFLCCNKNLEEFSASNLIKVGRGCLQSNEMIRYLQLDSLIEAGREFLEYNEIIERFIAPNFSKNVRLSNRMMYAQKTYQYRMRI